MCFSFTLLTLIDSFDTAILKIECCTFQLFQIKSAWLDWMTLTKIFGRLQPTCYRWNLLWNFHWMLTYHTRWVYHVVHFYIVRISVDNKLNWKTEYIYIHIYISLYVRLEERKKHRKKYIIDEVLLLIRSVEMSFMTKILFFTL